MFSAALAGDRWYWPIASKLNSSGELLNKPPELAAGLNYRGSFVINSAPGVLEFVIDTPPGNRVNPFHSRHDLKPASFWGEDNEGQILRFISSPSKAVKWSYLGFSHEELSGFGLVGTLPRAGTVLPVLVQRWSVPYWSVTLLSGFLPAIFLNRWIKQRHRHGHGLCTICGYDLRASPDRCPECGADAKP